MLERLQYFVAHLLDGFQSVHFFEEFTHNFCIFFILLHAENNLGQQWFAWLRLLVGLPRLVFVLVAETRPYFFEGIVGDEKLDVKDA